MTRSTYFNPFEDTLDALGDGVQSYFVNKHLAQESGMSDINAERSSIFLGALGTLGSIGSKYADQRQRRASMYNQKGEDYIRVPHYNDYHYQSVNPYNTSAFQEGGESAPGFDYSEAYDNWMAGSPEIANETSTNAIPEDYVEFTEEGDLHDDDPDLFFHNQQFALEGLFQQLYPDEYDPRAFEDDYDPTEDLFSDEFSFPFSPGDGQTPLPISPIVERLVQNGISVGSINTGEHNRGSLHPLGKAVDLPASTNGGPAGLRKIYQYLNSPEGQRAYPGIKVFDETTRPAGQKVWSGPHLHIQID